MKTSIARSLTALILLAGLALPSWAAAHAPQAAPYRYTLIDLGTLGGPTSFISGPGAPILNNQGMISPFADTAISDTDYLTGNPNLGQDPYIQHPFLWHNGVRTDLGALPGQNSSSNAAMNARGDVVGASETGGSDPLMGFPASTAVLWRDGRVIPLGTLAGGYESMAIALNDAGQAAGFSTNAVADPYCISGCWGAQTLAVRWGADGVPQVLGTLGGADSVAQFANNRGQIVGVSYTSAISNAVTGQPPQNPFLWQDGHMQDLGTLGGALGFPNALNNQGQVVGTMDLPGDQLHHGFVWGAGRLTDLGTLGGDQSSAWAINDAGDVVGGADVPGSQAHHAYLWKNGAMMDLGTLPGQTCSTAVGVNSHNQVVGDTSICGKSGGDPFLWEHGTLFNLRSLVAPTDLKLGDAWIINERGEIAGTAKLSTGETRAVLFVPTSLAVSEGLVPGGPVPGMPTTGEGSAWPAGALFLGLLLVLLGMGVRRTRRGLPA